METVKMFMHSAGIFFLSFGVVFAFGVPGGDFEVSSHSVAPFVLQKSLLSSISFENDVFAQPVPASLAIRDFSPLPPPHKNCTAHTAFPQTHPVVQKTIESISEPLPCDLLASLQTVTVFEDETKRSPRALAGANIIKIRRDVLSDSRLSDVLLHEMGHVIDLGGLTGTVGSLASAFHDGADVIYRDDTSVLFYQISWVSEKEKKEGVSDFDFVGGYAASDPFEDFAESFLYYIRHGNEFRLLADGNPALQEKYDFFKTYIFKGEEFESGNHFVNPTDRPWDITKH